VRANPSQPDELEEFIFGGLDFRNRAWLGLVLIVVAIAVMPIGWIAHKGRSGGSVCLLRSPV
jgi:hypothetical protein